MEISKNIDQILRVASSLSIMLEEKKLLDQHVSKANNPSIVAELRMSRNMTSSLIKSIERIHKMLTK